MPKAPAATPVFQNLIAGQPVPAASGRTIENRNPADQRDIVGIFPASGAAEVDAAVRAARAAFNAWRLTPAVKRAEILLRTGQLLEQRKEQYARDMTREMGKV